MMDISNVWQVQPRPTFCGALGLSGCNYAGSELERAVWPYRMSIIVTNLLTRSSANVYSESFELTFRSESGNFQCMDLCSHPSRAVISGDSPHQNPHLHHPHLHQWQHRHLNPHLRQRNSNLCLLWLSMPPRHQNPSPTHCPHQLPTLSDASSIDTLTSALTPLQHGDLAALGFSSWWPTGFCYWLYESLNVTFHLPWFWTIVAGTAVTRILILPLFITSQQNSARLAPHQPELLKLRDELTRLSSGPNKDPLAVQRIVIKQKKLYEKANVNMFPMLAMPFVQLPLQLGLFFGTRNLCQAPLEQMKWSGLEMMPDLTAIDPYYILPIASALLMQVQLHVGANLFPCSGYTPDVAKYSSPSRICRPTVKQWPI